jgi:hypothetical protein
LKVPERWREILLDDDAGSWVNPEDPVVAERVARFGHSTRAPLIVFACFADNAITHVANGRKDASAGTRLVRLNMRDIHPLARPILFSELSDRAPERLIGHLNRTPSSGGILPPKSLGALIDIVLELQPDLATNWPDFQSELVALTGIEPVFED